MVQLHMLQYGEILVLVPFCYARKKICSRVFYFILNVGINLFSCESTIVVGH
jgi:hypothetical protein